MENEDNDYRGIDLLLEVLEEQEEGVLESSNESLPNEVEDGNQQQQEDQEDVGAAVVADNANLVQDNAHLLVSPNRVTARLRHMTSSSAKRKMIKQSNCCFCRADCNNALSLEQHLQQNEACFIKYSRRHHLKTMDGLLSLLFSCLFCDAKVQRLSYHLQQKVRCQERYFERFDCNSIK